MTVAVEKVGGAHLPRVKSGEEKIYVTVRVRPLSGKEIARSDVSDWECTNDNTIAFKYSLPDRSPLPAAYTFDRVFGPDCQTQRVYEEGAKDVALSALTGLNSTIFAYGQTSSGKTFTMRGVTESAIADIFGYIQRNPDRDFVLRVSALEIYNEVVKDLLTSDSTPLRLLDDKERGTIVEKLQEEVVRNVDHLRQVIKICEAQRQVGETSLNDMSSRSHQIIRLTVESQPKGLVSGTPATSLIASLNFVDLAGSERASQTHADGVRLKEGAHINRSLLTLSTCIRKLSAGGKTKGGHIPYRDSKLTRILQHSLGGNARTAIICTMSPAHSHVEQSRNTLSFATRAKEVTNTAHVNMVVSDKVLVKQLQKEVARLEAELKLPEGGIESSLSEALLQAKDLQIQKMEEELRELQVQRDAAQARLDEVSRQLEAEEEAKQKAEEAAKKLAEEAVLRQISTNPVPYPSGPTPLSGSANRRRWSDSGDLSRRLEDQFQHPVTPPTTSRPRVTTMPLRQSAAASVMLVQEIRKLENMQDELGEDANRALEVLQKEVECLRLAQAGMNHDAASTIQKLQDEIHTMHNVRATAPRNGVSETKEDVATLRESISLNRVTLRRELSRLGEKSKSDAEAAIATLEEQLDSVQRSLDKMILENPASSPKEAGDSPRTPMMRKKKSGPSTPQSGSARQRITAETPCSPAVRRALKYSDNNENTPPRPLRENNPANVGESPRVNKHPKQGASPAKSDLTSSHCSKESPGGAHKRSTSVDIRKMQSMFKTAAEDNIKSIRNYVTDLKERVAKLQYQKQLLVCQVLELETNGSSEEEGNGAEDPDEDLALQPVTSPGTWKTQFEEQRAHILELWDMCHVSVIHRTQFYLLFKGDPADAIYMEVELRRLTWLQENLSLQSHCDQNNLNTPGEHLLPASPLSNSFRTLRRERELLAKQLGTRLSNEERESLYRRWGVPVDAKQRKLQLVYKLWIDPHNLAHVQASAEVVAKIVGILNPGKTSKEMFELNFAPPNNAERPFMFGWNGLTALLNNL